MEHSAAITIFGIISVFIAALVFYILSIFLGLLFKNRNVKAEEEIIKVIEESKTKDEDLLDDTELVAVITASISAYTGSGRFVIKSIKESKTPIWGMIDRLGDNI
ncbi:OadG family protein [Brachyspira catarrhinii]|uniref:Sodium pump decarboxylase subunit gamma n=1 Tax=Brachyspira catarrhinii TaxID=2528966 RepID=A0ABY2TQQ2_9SPIR|nr:OadG family protein [Brachyspira catarrhinii]TKZ35212.1 sodium pump decarboxylase subunit gamma [Brachyspira catarrhinii]